MAWKPLFLYSPILQYLLVVHSYLCFWVNFRIFLLCCRNALVGFWLEHINCVNELEGVEQRLGQETVLSLQNSFHAWLSCQEQPLGQSCTLLPPVGPAGLHVRSPCVPEEVQIQALEPWAPRPPGTGQVSPACPFPRQPALVTWIWGMSEQAIQDHFVILMEVVGCFSELCILRVSSGHAQQGDGARKGLMRKPVGEGLLRPRTVCSEGVSFLRCSGWHWKPGAGWHWKLGCQELNPLL